MTEYPWYRYRWGNNPVRLRLKGRLCKVLVRTKAGNSALVRFEDGEEQIISRNALEKVGVI